MQDNDQNKSFILAWAAVILLIIGLVFYIASAPETVVLP